MNYMFVFQEETYTYMYECVCTWGQAFFRVRWRPEPKSEVGLEAN